MTRTLSHARLEKAIYTSQSIAELIDSDTPLLKDYRVADYVGNSQIGLTTGAPTSARAFFEDAGAYVTHYPGSDCGKDFDIAVFATFLVVEIHPDSPHTEFLVLAPRQAEALIGGAYVGLMASQNTDGFREQADEPSRREALMDDVEALLNALAAQARTPPKGLIQRLLGR